MTDSAVPAPSPAPDQTLELAVQAFRQENDTVKAETAIEAARVRLLIEAIARMRTIQWMNGDIMDATGLAGKDPSAVIQVLQAHGNTQYDPTLALADLPGMNKVLDTSTDGNRYRLMRKLLSMNLLDTYALEGLGEEFIDAYLDSYDPAAPKTVPAA